MKRTECDDFLRGYLDAALFTTDENPPSGQDYVESGRADEMFPSLPDYFIEQARKDCAKFADENSKLLDQSGDSWQNGSDFWYTRNGHGVGFWDRGYADEIADPLSAEVKTDWHTLDAEDTKPTHYRLLLCTGGPAVQITGELSLHGEPETAELEHQDWFTPWTRYRLTSEQQDAALLAYAREFYFGR